MEEPVIVQEFPLTFFYRKYMYSADVFLLDFKGEKIFRIKYESSQEEGVIDDLSYNPYLQIWHSDLVPHQEFIDEIGKAIREEYLLMGLYKK